MSDPSQASIQNGGKGRGIDEMAPYVPEAWSN